MGKHKLAIAVTVFLGTLASVTALRAYGPQAAPQANPTPADVFAATDLEFRALYAGGRAATLEKIDPLIVVELDNLILYHKGKRTEAKVIPPLYHRLKVVSHIPLAIYVSLAPYGTMPIDDDRLGRLRTFNARVAAVQAVAGSDPASMRSKFGDRGRSLSTVALCWTVRLSAGKYDPAELQALTRAAGPIVLANASDAAKAEIDAYHAQITAWRRDIPPGDWSGSAWSSWASRWPANTMSPFSTLRATWFAG